MSGPGETLTPAAPPSAVSAVTVKPGLVKAIPAALPALPGFEPGLGIPYWPPDPPSPTVTAMCVSVAAKSTARCRVTAYHAGAEPPCPLPPNGSDDRPPPA